jgi:ABC-type transporter Mla subunit MlaD
MRVMTEQINTGQGAVGQAIYSEEFERKVETSLASLEATMRQAEKRMAELKPIIAEADAMTPELHGLVSESKQLVGQLNTTAGTVNMELEQLPDLITRMKLLLESTDRTLEGVQRMWPVSSAIRQPQPQELIETRPVNE